VPKAPQPVIGIDVGGTFTDFVLSEGDRLIVVKRPSTPDDPARAVLQGLAALDPMGAARVVHATTVATNGLLQRRGALTAFVTTEGFEDLLALGRGARRQLYALQPEPLPRLVPDGFAFGAPERVGPDGAVVRALTDGDASRVADAVARSGAQAVAVCLLFGYLVPEHEIRLGEAISRSVAAHGHGPRWVSLASDVLPEVREFERASTTVANAYIGPLTATYLQRMAARTAPRPLAIMGSHGGTLAPEEATRLPVATLLSGPAAGVTGALAVARSVGIRRVVTLDIGGTSTDCAASDGELPMVAHAEIDGIPVHRAMVDVHTIGAGGGSLVVLDEGGGLSVGPESAGAVPGPAAYGRGGTAATVTDANVVAGRLPAAVPLAGGLRLDAAAAREALAPVARGLGTSIDAAALAVLAVADVRIERALRAVTIERGRDAADFVLLAYGGAGPLHACAVADGLGMRRILIPPFPGALSAVGLLVGAPAVDIGRSVIGRPAADHARAFEALEDEARARLAASGVARRGTTVRRRADLRYAGQSWELTVPWPRDGDLAAALGREHRRHFGYDRPGAEVEVVTLRVRASGRPAAALPAAPAHASTAVPATVWLGDRSGEPRPAACRHRAELAEGERLEGPAVIVQADATTYVAPGWTASVHARGCLLLDR